MSEVRTALLGGLAPEIGWESLELLKKVMPQLRGAKRDGVNGSEAGG